MSGTLERYCEAVTILKNSRAGLKALTIQLTEAAELIAAKPESLIVPNGHISRSYVVNAVEMMPLPTLHELQAAVANFQRHRAKVFELYGALTIEQKDFAPSPMMAGASVH